MEINIVSKSKEESDRAFVNRQIKDRINTYISDKYNVKYDNWKEVYVIYKKPIYTDDKLKNIIICIIYNIDFLIKDYLKSNKYKVIKFKVMDDQIIANARNPNEVKMYQFNLEHWFNSIDNVKITIQKQYYDWKYE